MHDLPQLYQKPKAKLLLNALQVLAETSTGFSHVQNQPIKFVDPVGIPRYLTSIVSSRLDWIADEDVREQIWNLTSLRLSERSGSNAAPNQTRSFQVNADLIIQLHEPSLTGDNLGFKTWASSLLMSKQLVMLQKYLQVDELKVLELGAGTGLVGISAACLWKGSITLTDLPEILPNLAKNLQLNAELIMTSGGQVQARALDWSDTSDKPDKESDKFPVILAADPIYSPEHPGMLAKTILRWLRRDLTSRVMIELPLREHYVDDRAKLNALLAEGGLSLMTEGTETGYDDWQNIDGSPSEVHCWWGVWRPESEVS